MLHKHFAQNALLFSSHLNTFFGWYIGMFIHFFLNARVPVFFLGGGGGGESFCNKIGSEIPKTFKNACLETARVSV